MDIANELARRGLHPDASSFAWKNLHELVARLDAVAQQLNDMRLWILASVTDGYGATLYWAPNDLDPTGVYDLMLVYALPAGTHLCRLSWLVREVPASGGLRGAIAAEAFAPLRMARLLPALLDDLAETLAAAKRVGEALAFTQKDPR